MQLRYRKKVIDKQSLFNIHLARFTAELNQTVEEAYRSLDELLGPIAREATDEELRNSSPEGTTGRPPGDL